MLLKYFYFPSHFNSFKCIVSVVGVNCWLRMFFTNLAFKVRQRNSEYLGAVGEIIVSVIVS